jgi:hypothetical protein
MIWLMHFFYIFLRHAILLWYDAIVVHWTKPKKYHSHFFFTVVFHCLLNLNSRLWFIFCFLNILLFDPFGEICSAETLNWTEPASTIPLDFDSSTGSIIARPRNILQSLGFCWKPETRPCLDMFSVYELLFMNFFNMFMSLWTFGFELF